MEELKPERVATKEPVVEITGSKPGGPVAVLRPVQKHSKLEKTVGVLKAMLPIAQKILPLLDGQIGTAVSNLIGPQALPRQFAQTLLPLHEGLAQLEKQHIELRAQLAGQSAALKQVDEQIEAIRKLTEETADEQQNLKAELAKMRRKINIIALAGLLLLTAAVTLNVVLWVHIRRMLP
jgi:hypothetical protein